MTPQHNNTADDFDSNRHCRGTAVTGLRVTHQGMSDGQTSEAYDSSRLPGESSKGQWSLKCHLHFDILPPKLFQLAMEEVHDSKLCHFADQ